MWFVFVVVGVAAVGAVAVSVSAVVVIVIVVSLAIVHGTSAKCFFHMHFHCEYEHDAYLKSEKQFWHINLLQLSICLLPGNPATAALCKTIAHHDAVQQSGPTKVCSSPLGSLKWSKTIVLPGSGKQLYYVRDESLLATTSRHQSF